MSTATAATIPVGDFPITYTVCYGGFGGCRCCCCVPMGSVKVTNNSTPAWDFAWTDDGGFRHTRQRDGNREPEPINRHERRRLRAMQRRGR